MSPKKRLKHKKIVTKQLVLLEELESPENSPATPDFQNDLKPRVPIIPGVGIPGQASTSSVDHVFPSDEEVLKMLALPTFEVKTEAGTVVLKSIGEVIAYRIANDKNTIEHRIVNEYRRLRMQGFDHKVAHALVHTNCGTSKDKVDLVLSVANIDESEFDKKE